MILYNVPLYIISFYVRVMGFQYVEIKLFFVHVMASFTEHERKSSFLI
jgi:hypothetical protein